MKNELRWPTQLRKMTSARFNFVLISISRHGWRWCTIESGFQCTTRSIACTGLALFYTSISVTTWFAAVIATGAAPSADGGLGAAG